MGEEPKPVVYYVQQPPVRMPPKPHHGDMISSYYPGAPGLPEIDHSTLAATDQELSPFTNSVPYDPYLGYPKGIGAEEIPQEGHLASGLLGNNSTDSAATEGGKNKPDEPSASSTSANEPDEVVEDDDIPPPPKD